MNTYEYGDCLPDKSVVIDIDHIYKGSAASSIAQIGNTFIGNIIADVEVVAGVRVAQYWEDINDNELYRVEYDGASQIVSCYVAGSLVGIVPIPVGESFGIARVNGRIVLIIAGLDAFVIKESGGEEPINLYFSSNGNLRNIRAGYSEDDTFQALRESIHHTTALNPIDEWLNNVKMDCPNKASNRTSLLNCPTSTCNKKGECLAFIEYDKTIGVSGLKCKLNGLKLCRYTLGIVDSDDDSGKRLLLIDGSRGFVSTAVSQAMITTLFGEYGPYFGVKFEIVVSLAEREALVDAMRIGTFPDVVILDLTAADKPVMFFYRSLSGNIVKMLEVELLIPTSLGSDRLQDCRLPITNTFRGRDIIDPCISTVFNSCIVGCSGWINHPSVLENDWKTGFRVQGDLVFELRENGNIIPEVSLRVDISQHTLTISTLGFVTTVNAEILVGNLVNICVVGDVLSVYVDDVAHFRTVITVPDELFIVVECGSTITNALVDPRLNGKMLSGWLGDDTFEEISSCDSVKEPKEKFIVKDLYCDCDTGVIYYREITGTINKGEPQRIFKLDADVYRSFADIYIENRSSREAVITLYISKTTRPLGSSSIGSNIIIKPEDTYIRKSQPLAIGEALFVESSRDGLDLLLQTVEETFTR